MILPFSYTSIFFKLSVFHNSFGYVPHEKQLLVHCSNARFRTVRAGARAGKSMLAGAEGAFMLLLPGKHIWYISSLYELADKEFDWTIEFLSRVKIDRNTRLIDLARLSNPARGSRRIEFPWGSWAETKSSQKPESLLGEEIDLHIIGEASHVPTSCWDRQLYPRLGPRVGGALPIATPNWDSGFLRTMCDKGDSVDPDFSEYESWRFSVLDNPTFPKSEYEKAVKTLDKNVVDEQYHGLFVSRRGFVFPMFSEKHVVRSLPADLINWPVFRALHHERNAFNNPIVCLWIAIDPETGDYWIYDELYHEKALIADVCQKIFDKSRGRHIRTTIVDYFNPTLQDLVKNRLGSVLTNQEKGYTQKHALVRKIQVLHSDLKIRENGTPKVRIYKGCKNLISNFEKAKWPDPKKDEMEMAEVEVPTTKYMPGPLAVSTVVSFMRMARGEDIYSAQGRKTA